MLALQNGLSGYLWQNFGIILHIILHWTVLLLWFCMDMSQGSWAQMVWNIDRYLICNNG